MWGWWLICQVRAGFRHDATRPRRHWPPDRGTVVILSGADRDDADDGLDDVGDVSDEDGDGEVGEWLDGLRATGLPVRDTVRRVTDPRTRVPSEAVQDLLEESWATSTRASYEADWGRFGAWCIAHDLPDPLQADELDVAEWVSAMVAQRLAMATIRRRLAGVAWAYELTGRSSPTRTRAVRQVVAGAARVLGTAQRQPEPLRLVQLRRLVIGAPIVTHPTRAAVVRRNQVLLLVGWAAALRSEELVGLDVDDITFTGDPNRPTDGGMLIRVRRSKGEQTKPAHVAVPYSTHPSTCPVRLTMLHTRHVRSGAVFRHIDRHGHTHQRLQPPAVSRILKQMIRDTLTDNPDIYSSHSLRAGFVTEARHHHIPDPTIARHTRHTDLRMLNVYDRPTDLFNDPALTGEWW